MQRACIIAFLLTAAIAAAQAPPKPTQPPATLKQIMVDLIHPASNEILLLIYRGGPKDDKEWAEFRRGALTLAESGGLLMTRGQGDWVRHAKALTDAGAAAYQAAQAKDSQALASLAEPIDAACTACHKQYRPNVFPQPGGSK
jgi:hypothetical protein